VASLGGILATCGPELLLLLAVGVLTLIETVRPRGGARAKTFLGLAGLSGAFLLLPATVGPVPEALAGIWAADSFAMIFKVAILLGAVLALFLSVDEVGRRSEAAGEHAILVLLATVGMMIMASATDLLVLVLGLELMAVSFYVLVCFSWFREPATEAALKYVLTGLFASALLLYGVSLVYGGAGGTGLAELAAAARGGRADGLLVAGIALLACGLAFKMGAAPFHMWMPDVIEGAPTPVGGFLAVGPKAAVLAVAVRLFVGGFPSWEGIWGPLWWTLAALTILWGNLAALAQESLKRMLAYSSIAHVGYLLIALVAAGGDPVEAVGSLSFYLIAYVFMNLGAFGVVLWFEQATGEEPTWRSVAGMSRRSPGMALALGLFLLSLAGIPPTAGFAAKLWVFMAGWRSGFPGLVLLAALGSLIGAYYYLRAVYAMFLLPVPDDAADCPSPATMPVLALAVLLAAAGTIAAGVLPQAFMHLARVAAGG